MNGEPKRWEVAATIADRLFDMSMQMELLIYASRQYPAALPGCAILEECNAKLIDAGEDWHTFSESLMPDDYVHELLIDENDKATLEAAGLAIVDGDIVKVETT